MRHISISLNGLAHIFAAGLALYYAWFVSQSIYVETGFQFITPLLVIMLVHLIWLALSRGLSPGFSSVVYQRSVQSAVGIALIVLFASIVAPQPANSAGSDLAGNILTVVFCVAIIAIVGGLIALVIYAFFKIISALLNRFHSNDKKGPDTRLFDIGSLAVTGVFLCVCSFEGHPKFYTFAASNSSVSSHIINATPSQVWDTMEQATSPEFPLPSVLKMFPRPVDVVTDQGTRLGAMRQVKFQGREGAGYLTLKVIERSDTIAVFEVLSDTSPYANWVAHQRLIYQIRPEGIGTRLTVTLEYDRLLAPAWFFLPMTKGAAYLAMDVLARDVKARTEG